MKSLIYFLGLVVVAVGGYKLLMPDDELSIGDNVLSKPLVNPDMQSQPEELYPLAQPLVNTPRVDNKNQPWYSGSRDFMGDKTTQNATISDLIVDSPIDYGTKTFWTTLSQSYN